MNEQTLEVRYDENYGEHGIACVRMSHRENLNAGMDGLVVAHDLLEHVNGVENIGGAGDELMALGAIWCSRGHLGDLNRRVPNWHPAEESLGYDVERCFERWLQEERCFEWPVPEKYSTDHDEAIDSMLMYAQREFQSMDHWEATPEDWREFAADARKFIAAGYDKMLERYGSEVMANNMFWNMADAIDERIFSGHELFPGQRWTVTWTDHNDIRIEEDYDDYV